MAMPTSGCIGIKTCPGGLCSSISCAVDGGSGSLASLSVTAGKSAPHCMREFYGYAGSGSISVSLPSGTFSSGQIAFNTLTSSGAWVASKLDPDSIISSFTASGSGSQKVTAGLTGLVNPFSDRTATITYCLSGQPSINDSWTLTILAGD